MEYANRCCFWLMLVVLAMYPIHALIHANVRLHPEVSLLALLRLVDLGIARVALVLHGGR